MRHLILVGALAALPTITAAQDASTVDSYASRCGAAVSSSDRGGWVPLPRGDVFCPLIADPKGMHSTVSYQRGREQDLSSDIAAVGIADEFGFFRSGSGSSDNAIQLGVAGAVFAQFDIGTPSYDLLNADYLITLPLTFRAGWLSGRFRVYHQSSHLGDELLLRKNPPTRENLSFESFDGLLSADVGPLRVYGGGETFFARDSSDLPRFLVHSGAELRPRAAVRFGTLGLLRLVAAVDVKNVNDTTAWRTGISARAGFEISRPREGAVIGRRWNLFAQYYTGPSPYGQFFRSDVRLVGLGFDFSL
jgi:Protein of unknown function (DUF1207)